MVFTFVAYIINQNNTNTFKLIKAIINMLYRILLITCILRELYYIYFTYKLRY